MTSIKILVVSASLLAAPVFADSTQEVSTAAAHAGMAAAADNFKTVHFHIQHTLNCLEGKSGPDFLATGNPCEDMGAGAIPDSAQADQKMLQAAVAKAKLARDEGDFEKAKSYASDAQTLLSGK